MAYNIIIAPRAARQIADAMAWYANISPDIARKWRNDLLAHIDSLEHYPERCPRMIKESEKMNRDIRQLFHGKGRGQYCILFEMDDNAVNIISIRHAFRQRGFS